MQLFDTHAHIQEPEFKDDVDAVISRARKAGVTEMVVPGVDLGSARRAIALAVRHDGVYATAGYHPHEASHLDEDALRHIEGLLADPHVVAVGEIGLDYFRFHSTRREQLAAFEKMLALAERHTMPVIIHCRDAWNDTRALMAPWARRVAASFEGRPVGVMHYFSGSVEEATTWIDLGFLISIHTSVTHPKSAQTRQVAVASPLESLVIETDSPYGAPQAYRGKRNEPAYVLEACRQIALERGISETQVAEITTANARRLFGIPVSDGLAPATGSST